MLWNSYQRILNLIYSNIKENWIALKALETHMITTYVIYIDDSYIPNCVVGHILKNTEG